VNDRLTDFWYCCNTKRLSASVKPCCPPHPPTPQEELSAAQSGVSALAAVSLQLQQDNQELGSTVVNLQVRLDWGPLVGSTG